MEKEPTQSKMPFRKHTLMLEGRTRAKLAGVTAVSCFNDQEVVLETSEGEVALMGEGLHIEQLNLEDGQLGVTGEIAAILGRSPNTVRSQLSRGRALLHDAWKGAEEL